MTDHPPKRAPYLPLLFALLLLTGVFIGSRIAPSQGRKSLFGHNNQPGENLNDLINYIEDSYVDTVNRQKLYESAISGVLESLDPHSAFIPASSFHEMTDPLKGNFEGIGIQFRIVKDSIVVINTIQGGPSEKAGLRAGDRIVLIEKKKITGTKITDDEVVKKLKGPKGTKVDLEIFRKGSASLLRFNVVRDIIPTYSVDISYMITKETGFIKVSRFSATTGEEVTSALIELKNRGMKKLILDLRDNTGGYLNAATKICEEFLPDKALIVYTEGRKRTRESYYSNGKGLFQHGDLVVLINEGSASASEILAGALQDNDRGTIIGRRSFGKGLVQEELDFKDGSAVRLTVARYYTPTGRCIQKPYEHGSNLEYSMEAMNRFTDGETDHPDSLHFPDSLKFKTPKGKVVYGGGGIMPDIYIPLDKSPSATYFNKLVNSGVFYQYSFDFADRHRSELAAFKTFSEFNNNFSVSADLWKDFLFQAEKQGIQHDPKTTAEIKEISCLTLKSLIARILFDDKGFYPIYNLTDKTVQKALSVLEKKTNK